MNCMNDSVIIIMFPSGDDCRGFVLHRLVLVSKRSSTVSLPLSSGTVCPATFTTLQQRSCLTIIPADALLTRLAHVDVDDDLR